MSRFLTYTFSSYCPYLDELHSISIKYYEISTLGNPLGYKKGRYSCNQINECPYPSKGEFDSCPVYLNSPSEPL